MENKYFLVDADNAILDWSKSMFEFTKERYPDLELDINKYSFGLDYDFLERLWKEFNTTDAFGKLEPLRDSAIYLPKIAKELNFRFICITSCLPDSSTETYNKMTAMRNQNLMNVFGDIFEKCICIEVHQSKLPYLELFDKTFWIDDKMRNVEAGLDAGHTSYLMSHEYNLEDDTMGAKRVYNWKEIYDDVLNKAQRTI